LTRRVGSAGEAERILNGESEQVSQPASKKRETETNMDTARRIADPERDQVDRSARPQADGDRRSASQEGSEENLVNKEERQYLAVPYAEREAAKALGAKWDWREKLWYIGPEGTRAGLARPSPKRGNGFSSLNW